MARAYTIHSWMAWVPDVPEGAWERFYQNMDPDRQARCDRYRHLADRRRCILADAMVRHIIHARVGIEPGAIRFAHTDRGKPYLPDFPLHFSVSHSEELVVCAAEPFPVGIDVQHYRTVSPVLLRRAIKAGCPSAEPEDFFSWWTAQEAWGKFTGAGFRLDPPSPNHRLFHKEILRDQDRYHLCLCIWDDPLCAPCIFYPSVLELS